ncbi:MAG: diguanylate cyclase [Gammaproteobacteria bacterium]|nr:diguanylate cyclase [Gammaproteobacteria bacterium]
MSIELDEKTQIEKWKDKYYDSLDQLEAKEATYQKVEETLRSALSHLCIAAMGMAPNADKQLEVLRCNIRDGDDGNQLKASIKKIIDTLDHFEEKQSNTTGLSSTSNILSINEVLLQLLERLEGSAESAALITGLKVRLEQEVDTDTWPALIVDIAEAISGLRKKAQEEIKEVAEFLSQLTTRLQELEEYFQVEKIEHKSSLEDSLILNERVQSQVRGIENSVQEAADLDQVKLLIQKRMETISSNLEQFVKHEEQRNHDANKRTEILTNRLKTLEQESAQLRVSIHKEREAALKDTLTGLFNRLAYDERIEQEYLRWQRYQNPLSILVADVDFFKKINDTFGHKAGDKVLQVIAQKMEESVRGTDMVARYGGEEFVFIMPNTAVDNAMAVANKLRTEIEKLQFHYRDKPVNITISCGVSEFSNDDQPDTVFERADQALYEAKNSGRNCCVAK